MGEELSILELIGWNESRACGYCKGRKIKRNLGAVAYKLDVREFEKFLIWGWSRSGSYLYKPDMEKTCCPQYTIRLDVEKFTLSRTQKKVLRNMQLYLEKGVKGKGETEERGENKRKTEEKKENDKMEEKKKDADVQMEREGRGEKKKAMRRKRAIGKWTKQGLNVEDQMEKRRNREKKREKSLEERIGVDYGDGFSHRLEIQLVPVNSQEYLEKADEEYALFKKYQESIHSDEDVTQRGFDRFLVKTPLCSTNPSLGSFHMRYMMDGSIIAVGVVDILSESVSAKYLFYDPHYSFLSLGTYTALREIQLVRKLASDMPRLRYYYMGYYISDCPKMRYKGTFRPSDLLCDKTLTWVPLSECSPLLSSNSHLFTVFRPSLPNAQRLDPKDAKLYLSRGITNINSLPPIIRAKIKDKLESFCNLTTPDASKLVLVMKELQIEDDSDDDEEM